MTDSVPDPDAASWQPCFVDPWRGVAHFDGLTIEADPITSARPNRVLPCIEDEQVIFCRLLRAILKKDGVSLIGMSAIDLGSGSGVLALYGAKLGLQVKGVDCCERAIEFARFNDRAFRKSAVIAGACDFEHVIHWKDLSDSEAESVDYVFLNAPFSPQAGLTLPPCADGGPTGQDAFRSALPIAHRLLRENGRLFAIQLLLTDASGKPKENLLSAADGSAQWSRVRIYPILGEQPIAVSDFLRRQYRSLPDEKVPMPLEASTDYLCLAFIEFVRDEQHSASAVEIVQRREFPLRNFPEWTWEQRITWHRAVFENAATESNGVARDAAVTPSGRITFPSISLFLDRSHAPLFFHAEPSVESGVKIPTLTPIQSILDRWIQLNGLLDSARISSRAAFDSIMVEAAPWHTAQHRLDLRTETGLWASGVTKAGSVAHVPPPVARALSGILEEIRHINTKSRSVFRHRELEEPHQNRLWQPTVLFRYHEGDEQFSRKMDADPDLSALPSYDFVLARDCTVKRAVASYRHPLKGFEIGAKNPSTRPLEECLSAALHGYTAICRQEGLLGDPPAVCYFCSLPLPPPQPRSEAGTSGTLYVYGWSSREWTPDHEAILCDLAKTASLLYEEEYSVAARRELSRISLSGILQSAAHETGKLCFPIRRGLTSKAANLVRDSLYLTLELRPLGGTFAQAAKFLKENPAKSLRDLSRNAFAMQRLSIEEFYPKQLTSHQLAEWRSEADQLITVHPINTNCFAQFNIKAKPWFYFVAAFTTAVRNAIKNSIKKESKKIEVRQENQRIVIENSYISGLDFAADFQPYEEKQILVRASAGSETGTEQVLARHAAEILPKNSSLTDCQFIVKVSGASHPQGGFRHAWKTVVPLPAQQPGKFL